MHRARNHERGRVAIAVVAQVAHDLAQQHAAHRAAEADQPRQRADGVFGNHVGRQNHHQRGPGLLAEKGEAEQKNHPSDGMHAWREHHPGHQRRARAEREFTGRIHGKSACQQPTGKPAADQAADALCRVGNPADAARRFNVELKRVEQVF